MKEPDPHLVWLTDGLAERRHMMRQGGLVWAQFASRYKAHLAGLVDHALELPADALAQVPAWYHPTLFEAVLNDCQPRPVGGARLVVNLNVMYTTAWLAVALERLAAGLPQTALLHWAAAAAAGACGDDPADFADDPGDPGSTSRDDWLGRVADRAGGLPSSRWWLDWTQTWLGRSPRPLARYDLPAVCCGSNGADIGRIVLAPMAKGAGRPYEGLTYALQPAAHELCESLWSETARVGCSLRWALVPPPTLQFQGLDGDSLCGALAVARLAAQHGWQLDLQTLILSSALDERDRLMPVGYEAEKIQAAVESGRVRLIILAEGTEQSLEPRRNAQGQRVELCTCRTGMDAAMVAAGFPGEVNSFLEHVRQRAHRPGPAYFGGRTPSQIYIEPVVRRAVVEADGVVTPQGEACRWRSVQNRLGRRTLVAGHPGTGKLVLALMAGRDAAAEAVGRLGKELWEDFEMPLLVLATQAFAGAGEQVEGALRMYLQRPLPDGGHGCSPALADYLIERLQTPGSLLILHGLDNLPPEQHSPVLGWLETLPCRVLLTVCPGVVAGLGKDWDRYMIEELQPERVREFLARWYCADGMESSPGVAAALERQLKLEPCRSMSRNLWLLALLCLLNDSGLLGQQEWTRSRVCDEAIKAMLGSYERAAAWAECLQTIAWEMQRESPQAPRLEYGRLLILLRDYQRAAVLSPLRQLSPQAPAEPAPVPLAADALLAELVDKRVLVRCARGLYGWCHRSLGDALVSAYLHRTPTALAELANQACHPAWQPILEMTAERVDGAGLAELLRQLVAAARGDLGGRALLRAEGLVGGRLDQLPAAERDWWQRFRQRLEQEPALAWLWAVRQEMEGLAATEPALVEPFAGALAGLNDPEPVVRAQAAVALSELAGSTAWPSLGNAARWTVWQRLIQQLRTYDRPVIEVGEALAAIDRRAAIASLVHQLQPGAGSMLGQVMAAEALGRLEAIEAFPALCEHLGDPEPEVRESCTFALDRISHRGYGRMIAAALNDSLASCTRDGMVPSGPMRADPHVHEAVLRETLRLVSAGPAEPAPWPPDDDGLLGVLDPLPLAGQLTSRWLVRAARTLLDAPFWPGLARVLARWPEALDPAAATPEHQARHALLLADYPGLDPA